MQTNYYSLMDIITSEPYRDPSGVMANMLDCSLEVSEFKPQSCLITFRLIIGKV